MVDRLYHRANPCSNFGRIVRFIVEIRGVARISEQEGQDCARSAQNFLDRKPHPLIKSRDLEYSCFCAL